MSANDRIEVLSVGRRAGVLGDVGHSRGWGPSVEIVGEMPLGEEALEALGRLGPGLVLVAAAPSEDVLGWVRRLVTHGASPKLACLVDTSDGKCCAGLLRAGAAGLVAHDRVVEELPRAIRLVAAGCYHLSSSAATAVAARCLEEAATRPSPRSARLSAEERRAASRAPAGPRIDPAGLISHEVQAVVEQFLARLSRRKKGRSPITPRQYDVIRLLANGCSTAEIAAALRTGMSVVEADRRRIQRDLKLVDSTGAKRFVVRLGLAHPED